MFWWGYPTIISSHILITSFATYQNRIIIAIHININCFKWFFILLLAYSSALSNTAVRCLTSCARNCPSQPRYNLTQFARNIRIPSFSPIVETLAPDMGLRHRAGATQTRHYVSSSVTPAQWGALCSARLVQYNLHLGQSTRALVATGVRWTILSPF